MVNTAVQFCVFRIVLPSALAASVICRQNVLSLMYLLLLLVAPVVSLPSPKSMASHTGRYVRSLLACTITATTAQIIFQVVLLSLPPYGYFLEFCTSLETLFRIIGFQRYDKVDPLQAARLIGPEILMLVVSVIVFVVSTRTTPNSGRQSRTSSALKTTSEQNEDDAAIIRSGDVFLETEEVLVAYEESQRSSSKLLKRKAFSFLGVLGDVLAMALMASAGIIRPSITSAVYYLVFLAVATWVSCFKKLRKKYAILRIFIIIYTAIHLVILYIYQMPIFQELLPPHSLYARLFGLTAMIQTDCSDPRNIVYLPLEWASYVNPAILLALYWVLVLENKLWMRSPLKTEDGKRVSSGDGRRSTTPSFAAHPPPSFFQPLALPNESLTPIHYVPTSATSFHPHITTHRPSLLPTTQSRLRRTKSEKPPSYHRRAKTVRRQPGAKRNLSYGGVYESTPLLSADGIGRHYSAVEISTGSRMRDGNLVDGIEIDPNGSVILSNAETGIPLSEDTQRLPGRFRQLVSPLTSIFLLITKQSYIATLIVMMAWSITYHSWLTFVLLLWSCILWMMPNSRNACLRSSPALVIYAEALLIIQYIYGLSLTDDELPQTIEGVNLRQIGCVKYPDLPFLPLAIKVLYTLMFWITLRQYMEERYHEKNKDLMEGVMLEPFNMAYSTTRSGTPNLEVPRPKSMQESPFMKQLGNFVLSFLTTYWIWVVACMLMAISMQGEKVVIYRVMYMALFLFFILIFQLSYRWWRDIMYFFWLTVILYSMFVLILIYTYQFENFSYYWSTYLNISKKLQKDIGLEVYDTGQLFLKLLTPTFFVVITIIQLHYFHKDFLKISDIYHGSATNSQEDPQPQRQSSSEHASSGKFTSESRSETKETNVEDVDPIISEEADDTNKEIVEISKFCSETNPVVIGIPPTPTGDEQPHFKLDENGDQEKTEPESVEKTWKELIIDYLKRGGKHAVKIFDIVSEFVWRFLEIHMNKIVMFASLMLALYDVCAVHFVFVLLVTIALPFRFLQIFISHCCAVWSSVLLLSKMIYQIDYVEEVWKVNCTDTEFVNQTQSFSYPFNDTVNNAKWMGYSKVDNLPNYLKGYIGIIVVLSIQAVVRVRQRYHRNQLNIPEPKTGIIFTDITRADADNGLLEALKFLVNFAFYKFGVEINFMTMVAVIGIRLDILSVAYAVWLGALFLLPRNTLSRVWPFYVTFLSILLPFQYSMCVGIPPGFCRDYPWSFASLDPTRRETRELREWLYLPDFAFPLPAYKLAVDFFQLLFACCQLFVFKVEAQPNAESYEGGSNREMIYISANEQDENPICDFVTYTKSYLDLVKVIIFSLFYWITLAVIFLAGTNRVSLFAMGYVIGCFLFLWNGQDFYLKPLKTILRLWNTLLAYNIFVIFTKTILQMIGCVYIYKMLDNFCWAIQLFGIACIKKFDKNYQIVTKIGECAVPEDEAGLLWDGICLGFMLMQRRSFCSYYFHHLVTEMHAQTKLASRGAELINQLLMKEVREQEAEEREVMEKIKKKMDRIRANQQKIRGKEFSDHQDHFKTNTSDVSSASTPMYSLGTPSSLQLSQSQQEAPDTLSNTETRRVSINHFPSYPPASTQVQLHRHPSSSITRRRRRLRRSTRRSCQKSFSSKRKRKGATLSSSPPSPPPPLTPYPHPPSSPTGGGGPSSPGSPSCTFSLDGFMEPSLSVVGAPAGLFSYASGTGGGHAASNIGIATPTEDSFPFFSPPPYPVATSNSIRLGQRPITPHSNSRRSLHLNINHLGPHSPLPNSTNFFHQHHLGTSPPSSSYPPLNSIPTPRQSIIGLAPAGSIRRAYARRSSNPSSPTFSHHNSIRSGDYFMFEDNSDDDDLAELESQEKKSDEKDDDVRGMGVSKLLSSAMKSDIKHAMSEAKQVKEGSSPDAVYYRQTSSDISSRPPVSRTVSAVSGASSLPIGMSVSRQPSLRSQIYHEPDKSGATPLLHASDEKGYDSFGGDEGDSRSPPLPELENALQVVPAQEEDIESEETEGIYRKIVNWLKFALAFIEGLMVSATTKLNAISKDYRYVARCLAKEKKILKEKGFVSAESLRDDRLDGSQFFSSPHVQPFVKTREEPLEIRVEKASEDQNDGSLECLDSPEELEREFEKDQPVTIRLLVALWYALVSRSEIVCYIMIVMNQIKSASLLSLPLPCMVFLWGTFSLPRPTKTFWITIITYTEAVVVIKYLFQFEFFPWNEGPKLNPPFWPPRIIGVEKKEQYAIYDLALLMVIFFHRFILKSLGLWKDDESDGTQTKESLDEDNSNSTEKAVKVMEKSEEITRSSDSADFKDDDDFDDDEQELENIKIWSAKECILNYVQPFKIFFTNLFYPAYRVTVDVYAFMFLCDFATFLILVFGYWAFGPGGGDGGVTSYFEENQVPVPFLVMLIAQFALIIIDRALFLRKFILGKVIFQVAMVFIVHIWMFFVLPAVSERDFNSSLPPQLWYLVKCVYLLLSAYQIRSGYPTRILGNFVTKKYNYVNMFLFRGFMAVPFLFELRALMDWIWTETSMSLSSWLKMEDIFANIFILKCQRRAEAEYPTPRGEARKPLIKYGIGGSFLFIIIFIIWFPLVLFALGNTVGVSNPPYDVTIEITFGGYQPVFKMSAQHGALRPYSKKQYDDMVYWYLYRKQRDALNFLQNYDQNDIVVAELSGNSTAVWGISPPSQQHLIQDLMSKNTMTLKFAWYVTRATSNPDVLPTVSGELAYNLNPGDPIRSEFARMLNGTYSQDAILVRQFFPKFIRAPRRGKAILVKALLKGDPTKDGSDNVQLSNLTMALRTGGFLNFTVDQEWWEIREDCENSKFRSSPILNDCNYLRIITISDKAFPSTLSILSGYGIVGMYTTLVLLVSRFVRGLFAGVSFHIMFDDMPYVDRVLQLCRDIYLVRESGELHLEEDLFAKLIFLYRSPETLIKWTRFPQRENNSP